MYFICGVEEVIEVLVEVGNFKVKLVCVGDGNVFVFLKEKVVFFGVEKQVLFFGFVLCEDVMLYVENFDIVLQLVVIEYVLLLKMFEYMVLKSFIVVFDMVNLREILMDDCVVFFDFDVKGLFKDVLKFVFEDVMLFFNWRQLVYNCFVDVGFLWDKNVE